MALVSAYPFLPGHGQVRMAAYLSVIVAAAFTTGGLTLAHERLFVGARGYWLVYAWSFLNVGLVSCAVFMTGGLSSPLYFAYGLIALFVTSCYPWRAQLVMLVVTVAAYLGTLEAAGGRVSLAELFVRIGGIVIMTLLGASIASDKDRNAAEADRRARLVALVASVAREVSGANAPAVLDAVLVAARELGFEHAHVVLLDQDGHIARLLGASGGADPAAAPGSVDIRRELTALVRERRATVWLPGQPGGLDGAGEPIPEEVAGDVATAVGSPVLVDGELAGVLVAWSATARTLSGSDQEAFELLAGVTSRAFEGARRYELLAASEARMRQMALHDHLTGLANRVLFRGRLERALAGPPSAPIGCMLLDLDDFKRVNDTLGHAAGDALLRGVSRRVQSCLRPVDTLARLSGDEFGLLVVGLDPPGLERVAGRVLEALAAPMQVDGREVDVRASLGLVVTTPGAVADDAGPAAPVDRLLSEADMAMYEAKRAGKGQYVRFDRAMHVRMSRSVAVEEALRNILDSGELSVVYQPIFDLRAQALVGFEALARWDSPRLGLVAPEEFVPLAEQIGVIGDVGRFVLRQACEDLQVLRRSSADWADLSMSVNVSTRQLADPAIVDDVRAVLADTWTPPWCLVLEITESAFLEDAAVAEERLSALAALGIGVALDDFGTGYSSLSYLRDLKVHSLKIDRSFVAALHGSPVGAALLRSIVYLAGALGLSTVAEGIDSPSQLAAVRAVGCDRAQGFYLARPLLPGDLAGYVATQRVFGSRPPIPSAPAPAAAVVPPAASPPAAVPSLPIRS